MWIKYLRRLLRNIIKNIIYLCSHDLESKIEATSVENLKYELNDAQKTLIKISVCSIENTLKALKNTTASFCRFGDGEFTLLKGNSISFQQADPILSNRLKEILSSQDNSIFIGIPQVLFIDKSNVLEIVRDFWNLYGKKFRDIIFQYCHQDRQYYAAETTIPLTTYRQYNLKQYFSDVRSLWEKKKLTLICGEQILSNIRYNVFDNALSVDYLYAPSYNAFSQYPYLLKAASQIKKDHTIVIILGPTATVLAYDLAKKGYRALDLGHIAKTYDWYMRKMKIPYNIPASFFNPD